MDASGQLIPVTGTLVPGQNTPGPQGFPGQIPGQPTSQQPGNQLGNANQPGGPGSPNAALNLINSLLTSPRQTSSTPLASSGNQVGAIAGIASTHKGPSIKVYKDQDQYELWEFVFTPTASTVPGGGVGGAGGAGGNGQGRPNPTGNGLGNPPTFGNQPNGGGGNQSQGVFGPGNGPPIFAPGPGR